jgi:hypothetical protein
MAACWYAGMLVGGLVWCGVKARLKYLGGEIK